MSRNEMWFAAGAFLCSVGGALLLRSEYEREQLSVEYHVINTKKIGKDCRIVFLSDLHNHEFGAGNRRLIKAIDEADPDLILLGGDMMITAEEVSVSVPLELIRQLTRRYPVYYGNGNHETRLKRERDFYGGQYDSYVSSLRQMGVVILENRTEYFRGDIAITGIDLEERFYRKFKPDQLLAADIEGLVGKSGKNCFQILLSHSPLFFPAYSQWGADLTLAGHFHGGTIRIPYLGGVMTPQFQFFLPWCAGTFETAGKHLIVSRGLGTHSINIRLNNKPQVVVVDLQADATLRYHIFTDEFEFGILNADAFISWVWRNLWVYLISLRISKGRWTCCSI